MPAIDDLQARSQVLTAGGATIVINAIVIADGPLPHTRGELLITFLPLIS